MKSGGKGIAYFRCSICGGRRKCLIDRFPGALDGIKMMLRCEVCGVENVMVVEIDVDGCMDVDSGVEV